MLETTDWGMLRRSTGVWFDVPILFLPPSFVLFLFGGPAWRLNILLTHGYYHRGTRLNAMKRSCLCSLWYFPLSGGCSGGLDAFRGKPLVE